MPAARGGWQACERGVVARRWSARAGCSPPRHDPAGFEGLLGTVERLLDPLDPFAEAEAPVPDPAAARIATGSYARSVDALGLIRDEVVACRACPRLVAWREQVAREPRSPGSPTRPTGAGPCPGSATPPRASLILGLAPAAHGGNRTGRIFTGDRSGDFLFAVDASMRPREPGDVDRIATTGWR